MINPTNQITYVKTLQSLFCREIDRPPLLSGMPPLLFWDTRIHGSEVKDSLKSYSNLYEAKMACELIKMMLEYGIPGYQIGVIVLYKSQVHVLFS
jgi:hypothetical protein